MTKRFLSIAIAALLTGVSIPGWGVPAAAMTFQTSPKTDGQYFCPMDPEVRSASPGKCPKCGMTLRASSGSASDAGKPGASESESLRKPLRISDAVVYDQDGRKLNFYSDLIKGKTAAINFIFTTCTTICPPLAATFRKVQTEMGGDVELISVSVDPVTDVPARLKSFAAKFNAGPGWTFVTGEKANIDELLRSLGAYVGDKNDHSPAVIIINDNTGYWTRAYGLSPPGALVSIIKEAASPVVRQ